jgi:uncharacterized protein YbjQ (UPF0145 family)
MIVTTTPSLEGKQITQYMGVVTGEAAILGAQIAKHGFVNVMKDVLAGKTNVYEEELCNAREKALREMEERAATLGANAIVGVSAEYGSLGEGLMLVYAVGTAVTVE